MASSDFAGHFAHHRARVSPGILNFGSVFPHSHFLLRTLIAFGNLLGHWEHQRPPFSPGRFKTASTLPHSHFRHAKLIA